MIDRKALGLLVRHAITTAGGGLVTVGYISESDLGLLAGAGAVVVGLILSYVEKRMR